MRTGEKTVGRTLTWRVWTAVLAFMPSIARQFDNPVVPGQIDIGPLAVAIAVLAVLLFVSQSDKDPARYTRGLCWTARLGLAATILWAVAGALSWSLGEGGALSEPQMRLSWALYYAEPPLETLSLVGWVCLAAMLLPGEKGVEKAPAAYLVGTLWPAGMLAVGRMLPGGGILSPWGLLVCCASGAAAFALSGAVTQRGVGAPLVLPLLCGCAVSRAGIAIARDFLEQLPYAGPALGLMYLALVAVTFLALTQACRQAIPSGAAAGPTEPQEPTPRELVTARLRALEGSGALSERELDSLVGTLLGETGPKLAEQFGVSASTVGSYRKRGYEKLGVQNKTELASLVAAADVAAVDAPSEDDREPQTEERPAPSRRQRVAFLLGLAFVLLYRPPNNVPLLDAPSWFSWTDVSIYLVGIFFVVVGLARWVRREKTSADSEEPPRIKNATSTGRVIAWMGLLSTAGYLCMYGWHLGGSSFFTPWRIGELLWAVLGLTVVILGLGIRCYVGGQCRSFQDYSELFLSGLNCAALYWAEGALLLGVGAWLLAALSFETELFFMSTNLARLFVLLAASDIIRKACKNPSIDRLACQQAAANQNTIEERLKAMGITDAQVRVIALSLANHTDEEIASELFVTPSTVRSYRSRAYKLLGVRSLQELRTALDCEKRQDAARLQQ